MTATRSTASVTRWRSGVVMLGIGVLALSACGNDTASTSASGSAAGSDSWSGGVAVAPSGGVAPSAAATSSSSAAASGAAAGGAVADGAAVAGAPVPALDNRQVIRTADLQIRLAVPADTADDDLEQRQQEELEKAVSSVRAQLLAAGGFVADLRQAGNSASLILRVPAAGYDAFRAGAHQLGEVTSSTEAAQDVTDEYTDVESRIASMRTSVDRIRTLLSEATAVGDIISIESELSRREADLESLQGRRQVLADQVALGSVSLTLTAVRAAADSTAVVPPEEDRGGFLGGLADGWNGLLAFLTGVGVVVGAVLPFVPLVAVAALVAWWVRRTVRRHRGRPVTAPRVDDPTPA